jgi:hypothetical protein
VQWIWRDENNFVIEFSYLSRHFDHDGKEVCCVDIRRSRDSCTSSRKRKMAIAIALRIIRTFYLLPPFVTRKSMTRFKDPRLIVFSFPFRGDKDQHYRKPSKSP